MTVFRNISSSVFPSLTPSSYLPLANGFHKSRRGVVIISLYSGQLETEMACFQKFTKPIRRPIRGESLRLSLPKLSNTGTLLLLWQEEQHWSWVSVAVFFHTQFYACQSFPMSAPPEPSVIKVSLVLVCQLYEPLFECKSVAMFSVRTSEPYGSWCFRICCGRSDINKISDRVVKNHNSCDLVLLPISQERLHQIRLCLKYPLPVQVSQFFLHAL